MTVGDITADGVEVDCIPIIDMAPWYNGTEHERIRVAKELGEACEKVGFFILENTRVPENGIKDLFDVTLRFFQLPDEDFFSSKCDKHISALRTIHYPAQIGRYAPRPGQIRASQHTDYGALTLLTEKDRGLQVRKKDGTWLDVVVPQGAYVVNIGDMMARWTNDKWRSTTHRVINADEVHKSQARQSVAFFVNLNPDATVSTIESCITEANPNKYTTVIAGEYLMKKHAAAMKNAY
eukprot:GEMP01078177.1.p1 GENE.GEMP01078177.1~~GEMP01078177.1.p1  ORF type:complete len:237 (+),score=57.85 GEMP01078177.1:224-934(+)